jgi:carboxylesterase type B
LYLDANEGALFVLGQYQSPNISTEDYTTFLHDNFGSAASTVAKAYPLTAFQASPVPVFTAMSTIITDASYFCPAYRALKLAAKNGVPAWTYLWNHTDTCAWFSFIPQTQEALELFSATHTAEIPFVFGNLDSLPRPNGTCNLTTAERDISATLISAWTAMANTSDPSSSPDKGLFWPSWNASSSLGINIGESVTVSYVNYTACELWDALDATVLNFTVGSTTTTAGSANATSSSSSSSSSSSKSSAAGRSMSQPLVGVKISMLVVFGGLVFFL